jgi:glycosyltransferase involved in cell wall biosynthesis
MKILTILPVSRIEYLDKVLESLINQSYEERTALLVVVDGNNELYVKVHNKLASIPLNNVLCIQSDSFRGAASTIPQRRWHISAIHNQIKGLVGDDIDWIFSIEDDGILPVNALSWLVNDVQTRPDVGLVTGVELGRWGVPYVGAWKADDINNPQKITSLENKVGSPLVEEIDACGLYCALIRADLYKLHDFNSKNGLGPDINLALDIRQCGFKNYIDWSVPVTHLTDRHGKIIEIPATNNSLVINLTPLGRTQTWHAGL